MLRPLWRARWTVLVFGLVAVAGVQFAFYASLERIPVSTTLLIEYLAPIALVLYAWVRTRRMPQRIVLGEGWLDARATGRDSGDDPLPGRTVPARGDDAGGSGGAGVDPLSRRR